MGCLTDGVGSIVFVEERLFGRKQEKIKDNTFSIQSLCLMSSKLPNQV